MRTFAIIFFALLMISCDKQEPDTNNPMGYSDEVLTKAKGIHDRVLKLDTHVDINIKNFTEDKNYNQELETQVNLPFMDAGDLDVAWLIVYTGQGELNEEGYKKAYDNAISKFDAIHKLTKELAPNRIALATTSKEAKSIHAEGKRVAMIGIENGYPVGTDVSRVKEFYDLGARYMSLSHNGHSQLCDSNTGEKDSIWLHNGVSELGKKVMAEMNKWGIMIDVSHPSKKSMKDMIEMTKAPIIASHSSARALCGHSRNLDDEQLQWMKENGGVVQTVAFSSYLKTDKHNAYRKALNEEVKKLGEEEGFEVKERSEVRKMKDDEIMDYIAKYRALSKKAQTSIIDKVKPVDVADFVDHIDYLIEKTGIDHVGISSDFDGGGGVYGWNDASETLNVTAELVKRGYTETQIAQLWSGNLLRVLDEVESVAKKIQSDEVE